MWELGWFCGDDCECGGICPGCHKGGVVEQRAEHSELERLVILPTNDKIGG